jgi:hypothetical protein
MYRWESKQCILRSVYSISHVTAVTPYTSLGATDRGQLIASRFFPKKLNNAQRSYSTYDRELLAIYEAIKHFRHSLEGRIFVVQTDHKPLVYAFRQRAEKASPRQLRHLDFIGQFTTEIEHISGEDNVVADTLSRIEKVCTPTVIKPEELAEKQERRDPQLRGVRAANTTGLKLKKLTPSHAETAV